jgi:hypothetical protein
MAAMNSKHMKIMPNADSWLVKFRSEEYQVNYTKNDEDHKCQNAYSALHTHIYRAFK